MREAGNRHVYIKFYAKTSHNSHQSTRELGKWGQRTKIYITLVTNDQVNMGPTSPSNIHSYNHIPSGPAGQQTTWVSLGGMWLWPWKLLGKPWRPNDPLWSPKQGWGKMGTEIISAPLRINLSAPWQKRDVGRKLGPSFFQGHRPALLVAQWHLRTAAPYISSIVTTVFQQEGKLPHHVWKQESCSVYKVGLMQWASFSGWYARPVDTFLGKNIFFATSQSSAEFEQPPLFVREQ